MPVLSLFPANNSAPSYAPETLTLEMSSPLECRDCEMAVLSWLLPETWKNITTKFMNNQFSYKWIDGSSNLVTVTDGIYAINGVSTVMQQVMATNTHYLVDDKGNNVYFLSITMNETFNAAQINAVPVPSSLPTGYTQPVGATWSLPVSPITPQLIVPTPGTLAGKPFPTSFSSFIGTSPGTYPPTPISTNYAELGTSPPQQPVQTVVLTSDRVSNRHNTSKSMLYALQPVGVSGENLVIEPYNPRWVNMANGIFSTISFSLQDQFGSPLAVAPNWSLTVEVRPRTVI